MFPVFKNKTGFEITFDNEVTVSVEWDSFSGNLASARASHSKTGDLHVTSFEKKYTEGSYIIKDLSPDQLLRFFNKACSMRFTEEGEQCIAFFDFR
tara:strand:- start:12676 stop:12963 length:288 start_codon:yes stop_codon:yes gene_type:complete